MVYKPYPASQRQNTSVWCQTKHKTVEFGDPEAGRASQDLRELQTNTNMDNHRVFKRVVPPHNISFKLKRLEFCECPKIKNIFSALLLHNFPNLEELQVLYYENVEEIIVEVERSDRGGHREDDGNTITLPNLKKLCLGDLPRLNSIYKGIMVCESLQQIGIWWCPMLRRLPISLHMNEDGEQASAPPALRSISGSAEWWESLKWDNPLTKTTLQPFFPRII
ncbi:hypothetical protein HYC85_009119 [Camellia sinensis]|uniref:Disease resistance protein At4g27190-like leucine-rich repeats domain-containing protein n=1 Tax=Camellia sinensis TaxID=4442 RepID=A0A7J7HEY0_CAMSI|nr:hypothetical protein HYC85_009119 [Camellia sinensis]